jgi:hypothetical protein
MKAKIKRKKETVSPDYGLRLVGRIEGAVFSAILIIFGTIIGQIISL